MSQHTTERPQWVAPPRWSTWVLGAAALAGIVLASVSTWVHHEVTHSSTGFSSFCNLNATINCDTVVTSPYGVFLGVPVSVWAVGFYGALLLLTLRVALSGAPRRDRARADAFGLAVAGTLFSAYLAGISAFVVKTVCLLCAGLYVVTSVSLTAAWFEARPLREAGTRLLERWHSLRTRPALSIGAAAAVLGVFAVSGWLGAQTRLTREQVLQSNPQFFDWYTSQPIVEAPLGGGDRKGRRRRPFSSTSSPTSSARTALRPT